VPCQKPSASMATEGATESLCSASAPWPDEVFWIADDG
jgi:hypothetical protein